MMRNFILTIHIITSFVACVVTLWVLIRGLLGYFGKVKLKKRDVKLPLVATVLLYFQLLFGTLLYIAYMITYSRGEIGLASNASTASRFWAVEHFILMVFTLVISHIGWIFAKSCKTPIIIFRTYP
jgi:hypothetical protein